MSRWVRVSRSSCFPFIINSVDLQHIQSHARAREHSPDVELARERERRRMGSRGRCKRGKE